jgi:hypothetical protein
VQLQFPIREGISQTEAYRAATRRGEPTLGMAEATGLKLREPDRLRLLLHDCPAGTIPVLRTGCREDFADLVRALAGRNEPIAVPPSQGACMVKGFNNWDRVRSHRAAWEAAGGGDWDAEFQRLLPRKELYQDRFLILSEGPYSGAPAAGLGLGDDEWRELSAAVRLEHECTHYLTERVFGSARNNLHDELVCDFAGIVRAAGRFRADWFLRFMGLEAFPAYRPGGRLENYRGQPPLSEGAFRALQALVRDAALRLEAHPAAQKAPVPGEFAATLVGLYRLTLEEIAGGRLAL